MLNRERGSIHALKGRRETLIAGEKAKRLCPFALSHQEKHFPGPLKIIRTHNWSKVQETQFPAGVLEGQSPSILFSFAVRFSAACKRPESSIRQRRSNSPAPFDAVMASEAQVNPGKMPALAGAGIHEQRLAACPAAY